MTHRGIRWLFALVVASLLFSSLAQRYLGHVLENPNLDFYDYYLTGQMVHDSPRTPLYQGATDGNPQLKSAVPGSGLDLRARRAGLTDIELYLYPPLLADMLAPVTRIPMMRAAMLWRALNLLAVLFSVVLVARMIRLPVLSFEFASVVTLAYAFWPVHEAISLGQVAVLMLALWTVGVVAYAEGRTGPSAIAMALATALKVTPIMLLPLFFLWKDKRWLAWYAGTLVILLGVMAAINGEANLIVYSHVMQSMGTSVPAMQNKCLGSLLAWLYYGRVFTITGVQAVLASPHPVLSTVSKVSGLALYVACLAMVSRRSVQESAVTQASTLAVFTLVTALISPVSWRHGYTVAVIPLILLWTAALRNGATRVRAWLLTFTTASVGSLAFDLAAQAPLPNPIKIMLASVWIVSTLLLCVEVLLNGTGQFTSAALPVPTGTLLNGSGKL